MALTNSQTGQQTIPLQVRALREYAAPRGWQSALQVKEVGSGASACPDRRVARVLVTEQDRVAQCINGALTEDDTVDTVVIDSYIADPQLLGSLGGEAGEITPLELITGETPGVKMRKADLRHHRFSNGLYETVKQ